MASECATLFSACCVASSNHSSTVVLIPVVRPDVIEKGPHGSAWMSPVAIIEKLAGQGHFPVDEQLRESASLQMRPDIIFKKMRNAATRQSSVQLVLRRAQGQATLRIDLDVFQILMKCPRDKRTSRKPPAYAIMQQKILWQVRHARSHEIVGRCDKGRSAGAVQPERQSYLWRSEADVQRPGYRLP